MQTQYKTSTAPHLFAITIGKCACCGTPVLSTEPHALGHHGQVYCLDHRPSANERFCDLLKAVMCPDHGLWKDVEQTIDAFFDLDDLRSEITGAKRVFTIEQLVAFAQSGDSPGFDEWMCEYFGQIQIFISLSDHFQDGGVYHGNA